MKKRHILLALMIAVISLFSACDGRKPAANLSLIAYSASDAATLAKLSVDIGTIDGYTFEVKSSAVQRMTVADDCQRGDEWHIVSADAYKNGARVKSVFLSKKLNVPGTYYDNWDIDEAAIIDANGVIHVGSYDFQSADFNFYGTVIPFNNSPDTSVLAATNGIDPNVYVNGRTAWLTDTRHSTWNRAEQQKYTGRFTCKPLAIADRAVEFISLDGPLPDGISQSVTYYVVGVDGNEFSVALSQGGTPIGVVSNGSEIFIRSIN